MTQATIILICITTLIAIFIDIVVHIKLSPNIKHHNDTINLMEDRIVDLNNSLTSTSITNSKLSKDIADTNNMIVNLTKSIEDKNNIISNAYSIVQWPESQIYMDHPKFKDSTFLLVDGSSQYAIPNWLIDEVEKDRQN